jgi:ubiquinone/menaquinone biosynthesis C-methylase UbiE
MDLTICSRIFAIRNSSSGLIRLLRISLQGVVFGLILVIRCAPMFIVEIVAWCRKPSGRPTANCMVGAVSDRYVPAAGRRVFTPLYDAINALAMRQGQWRPRLVDRALASRALPSAPIRILDLGCGTAEMALAIARASPAVHLIGVDGDPDILDRAAAKARAAGIGLELHEALADRLPLPTASVDCVVSTLMFHHLAPSTKRAALAEARRVLVPAAPLLICDLGRATDPLMRAAFFAVQLLDGFPNTRAHARGELPEIVSQSGFSSVTVFARYRTGAGTLDLIEAAR